MEVAEDRKSAREQSGRRPRLYVEYLIDCPPCSREERRQLGLSRKQQAAGHRRRRAGSPSTADDPVPPRSLPATPTTEIACPIVENHHRHPAEFQRRTSPFRRGYFDPIRRPASATPAMSGADPPQTVVRPRPLRVGGQVSADAVTADTTSGDGPKQVCSLQAMIRHRRTLSNSSNSSNSSVTSNLSVPEHHQQHHEQVRTSSASSLTLFIVSSAL